MLEKAHGMRYNSKAASHICRCDGIGRRSGLKIHRWRQRTGSSPVTGTTSLRTSYRSQRLFYQKVTSHAFCRSSFPNRTRFAGFASVFFLKRKMSIILLRLFFQSQSALTPLLLLLKPNPLRWASLGLFLTESVSSVSINTSKSPIFLEYGGLFAAMGWRRQRVAYELPVTGSHRPCRSVRSSRASARWASRPRAARCGQTRCLRPARPPAG